MNGQYEVLNPWAEVDPIPLRGISPRVADLEGKSIGLLCGSKVGSRPILTAVEKQLKPFSDMFVVSSHVHQCQSLRNTVNMRVDW